MKNRFNREKCLSILFFLTRNGFTKKANIISNTTSLMPNHENQYFKNKKKLQKNFVKIDPRFWLQIRFLYKVGYFCTLEPEFEWYQLSKWRKESHLQNCLKIYSKSHGCSLLNDHGALHGWLNTGKSFIFHFCVQKRLLSFEHISFS